MSIIMFFLFTLYNVYIVIFFWWGGGIEGLERAFMSGHIFLKYINPR